MILIVLILITLLLMFVVSSCIVASRVDEEIKASVQNNEINRNIIENSYYMIKLFFDDGKEVTNLKLQNLMYFVEAYYMDSHLEETHLYDLNWTAWNYGVVVSELYQKYKRFGNFPIRISEEEKTIGESLSEVNKKCIEKIYSIFGELSVFELEVLTHLESSPWRVIYNLNKQKSKYDFEDINNKSLIPKKETAIWFKNNFGEVIDNKVDTIEPDKEED